eukprot:566942-Rhodomonas_salina.1
MDGLVRGGATTSVGPRTTDLPIAKSCSPRCRDWVCAARSSLEPGALWGGKGSSGVDTPGSKFGTGSTRSVSIQVHIAPVSGWRS